MDTKIINAKKVSKELQNFINSISVIRKSKIPDDDGNVYCSKIDGSYLTHVGSERQLKFLLDKGITQHIQSGFREPITACIGFNPTEQKWYGWSHRAIFGFGVGSKCKQGDAGFEPSNKLEFMKRMVSFWGDNEYFQKKPEVVDKGDGCLITYIYNNKVPNKELRGKTHTEFFKYPKKWGKGEWTASTIKQAKQMAINFAKSVS